MTHEEDTMSSTDPRTRAEMALAKIGRLEDEISRQRLHRETATYRLEWAVRERERLRRHLASLGREEGAA